MMDLSIIDTFIIAPLAPVAGIVLFWFIQLLFAESLKVLLREIWENHKAFCRFSNFVALFFQSLSHALGYTLTGIGVGEFSLSVKDAKVSPKKEKKGLPMFLANLFLVLGPFFIPPLIVFLIYLPFFPGFTLQECYTFSTSLISFGSLLQQFGINFLKFLFYLDLSNPFHIIFLIIFLLVGLGIRPSFIEEEEKRVGMVDDLLRVKDLVSSHPYFIIALLVSLYIVFYVLYFLNLPFYVLIFSFFGWLSIISITSLLLAHFIVFLVLASDRLPSFKRFLPFSLLIISYTLYRFIFYLTKSDLALPLSNIFSLATTFVAVFLVLRFETNKLKMEKEMVEAEEREDED